MRLQCFDSDVTQSLVPCCRLIKTESPSIEIVCELISKASIGYVSTSLDGNEYMSPAFVSGQVFTPAILDNLMAQAYFSPHVRSGCGCDSPPLAKTHCVCRDTSVD